MELKKDFIKTGEFYFQFFKDGEEEEESPVKIGNCFDHDEFIIKISGSESVEGCYIEFDSGSGLKFKLFRKDIT